VYSFGVVLWECFARTEPWPSKTPLDVALDAVKGRPIAGNNILNRVLQIRFLCVLVVSAGIRLEAPSNMPPAMQQLMKKCFEGDPAKRPTFVNVCNELASELN